MGKKTPKQIQDEIKQTLDYANKLQSAISKAADSSSDIMDKVFSRMGDITKKVVEKVELFADKNEDSIKRITRLAKNEMSKLNIQLEKDLKIGTLLKEKGFTEQDIEDITDKVLMPFNKIQSSLESLPLGKTISNALGLDKLKTDIIDKVRGPIINSLVDGKLSFTEFGEIGSTVLKGLSSRAILMAGAIGLVAFILKSAIDRYKEIDEATIRIRKETGLYGNDLQMINMTIQRTTRNLAEYGATVEQASESITALTEQFGLVSVVTKENVETLTLLNATIGLGASEGTKLIDVFSTMRGQSIETADNLIATTISLSKARGVAPKAVLQDIANSSERIYEFISPTPEILLETATRARQLGLSLDTVAGIAEKLTDFESSIESEMNAMVLTGRQLNLQQARYFAITGDTAGLLSEIESQIGGVEQLNSMLPFQQKAFADALGLSVNQLRTMIRNQEISQKLADGTLNAYDALAQGESLESVLGASKIQTPLENMTNSFNEIVIALSDILYPIFQVLAVTILPLIAGLFKGIAAVIKPIVSFMERLFDSLGLNSEILTDIFETIGFWVGYIGTAIGIVAAAINTSILAIAGIIMWLGGVIWEFIVKPFEDAWNYLFGHTVWSKETVGNVFNGILNVLSTIGGAIIDVLLFPFEFVYERITNIFSSIGEIVGSIIDTVASIFGGNEPEIAVATPTGAQPVMVAEKATPGGGVGGREVGTKEATLQDVIDVINTFMTKFDEGVDLKLQGAKIGEFLAKTTRK